MHSRYIDNYLSQEERELISMFIQRSMSRFEKYNGLIRMAPQRYNTDALQKLYITKYNLWEKAVKTQMSEAASTYLDIIRVSTNPNSCPIERFLKTFMQIIEQSIPPDKLSDMIGKLESEVVKCEFPCPCPAEP